MTFDGKVFLTPEELKFIISDHLSEEVMSNPSIAALLGAWRKEYPKVTKITLQDDFLIAEVTWEVEL